MSEPLIVYWSSSTLNTHRFVQRLGGENYRIPNQAPFEIMTRPFVLFCPTYADGNGRGAVPKPVLRFLAIEENRALMKAIVGGGNRNFGTTFILGAKMISQKCQIPIIGAFELSGTDSEAALIRAAISNLSV